MASLGDKPGNPVQPAYIRNPLSHVFLFRYCARVKKRPQQQTQAPVASPPDPDPLDTGVDHFNPRGEKDEEMGKDRSSRSRHRSDKYSQARAARRRDRSYSPVERGREAEISVVGESDSDLDYHQSKNLSSRARKWRDGASSSKSESEIASVQDYDSEPSMDYSQNFDRENTANETMTNDREPAAPPLPITRRQPAC